MRQGSFWDLPFCRLFVGVRNFRLELEIEKFRVSSCAVSCSIRFVELSIGCAHSLSFSVIWWSSHLEGDCIGNGKLKPIAVSRQVA